jgi:2-oxoisovalerate dehydrogenase E1 component alpha subunit
MVNKGWITEADEAKLFERYREEVLAAVKVAEKLPIPKLDEIIEDVLDKPTPALRKQLKELKEHITKYPKAYPKSAGRL